MTSTLSSVAHRPPPDIDPASWQAVILDIKEGEPLTAMAVLLAGVTGTRRGELCGLRWSDIDRWRCGARQKAGRSARGREGGSWPP